jgi:hypothetical protein
MLGVGFVMIEPTEKLFDLTLQDFVLACGHGLRSSGSRLLTGV